MKILLPAILILCALLLSCSTKKGSSNLLHDQLIGEWRNTYLKVTMPSPGGVADSTGVIEADSVNWEDVIHMKPIKTFFMSDSTFHSDHYSPADSLLFIASGSWYVEGDTLVMEMKEPSVSTIRLYTSIKNGVAKFKTIMDFDDDGQNDDEYIGWQKKY